ncbi:MAG: SWIM zinc finger family protein [Isosphaeraceae bacterium]
MTTASQPRITQKLIKARIGEANLIKGRPYAANGSVFDTKRQGPTLKARVQGRQHEPYRVSVTCDETGIASSHCSCPVGGGGYCKHVAAVLLAWMRKPDAFLEVEDLDAVLESWDKDELIELVHRMLRRAPELEILLETPPPGARDRGKAQAHGADFYRRQAETAFRLAGDDWRASFGVAQDLGAIRSLGDELLKHGDVEAAEAVYEGLLAGILLGYRTISDEEGEIGGVAGECAEGLGRCLNREDDPSRRESMLRALFDLYRFDVELGGYGFADEAPGLIVEHARAEERRMAAAWVRETIPVRDGRDAWGGDYQRRVWGRFLLDLEADILDDEAYLRVCRETGRTLDVIERLLELGRIDEAREEAAGVPIHESLAVADLFLHRGLGEWAEEFVVGRSARANGTAMLEWLKRRALSRRDRPAALDLALRIFRQEPTLRGYREIRKLAGPKKWPEVRGGVLADLSAMRYHALLVEIALAEKDFERAVELVGAVGHAHHRGLAVQVADAVADRCPEAAIELYRREAELMISLQGRDNYEAACQLIARIRKLHRRLEDEAGWSAYRDDLLGRHRRLRAFQDEFKSAKLDR